MKSTNKFLNLRSANYRFPAFSLKIYCLQPETVFFDNAINSFICRFSRSFPCFFYGTAIPHRNNEVDDELLKKLWRISFN